MAITTPVNDGDIAAIKGSNIRRHWAERRLFLLTQLV
jgi:hypothetical protein